jgi:hypothetical protein
VDALVQGWQRLTPQRALVSTGVLCIVVVAVASPYAVFRAADLIWPPPLPAVPAVVRSTKRLRKPVVSAPLVLQGELFQFSAIAV